MLERVRKKQESYERQKARQRQMRHDRGLKPLGSRKGRRKGCPSCHILLKSFCLINVNERWQDGIVDCWVLWSVQASMLRAPKRVRICQNMFGR